MTTKTERNHSYSSHYKDTGWQDIGTSQSELTKFFLRLVVVTHTNPIHGPTKTTSTYSSMQKVFLVCFQSQSISMVLLFHFLLLSFFLLSLHSFYLCYCLHTGSIVSNKDNDIFSLTIPEGVTTIQHSSKNEKVFLLCVCAKPHKANNVKEFFF